MLAAGVKVARGQRGPEPSEGVVKKYTLRGHLGGSVS